MQCKNSLISMLVTNGSSTLCEKYLRIFFVVALYWTVSIITVFVNKTLFHSNLVKLDATLFVTWFQCLTTAVLCSAMSFLSQSFPGIIKFPKGSPYSRKTFIKVIPVSILFTIMVATNNLCLRYVSVAFYYVSRSLTTVFNLLLSYALLRQKQSLNCVLCCLIIICGFWLGVDQESLTGSFSLVGTMFGVIGSFSLSLYSIFIKRTLVHVNQEVLLLSYYNNVYSCVLFLPLIYFNGEFEVLAHYQYIKEVWFYAAMFLGGLCGFAIGFVTTLQIKVTSPLTHNISGTGKACAQTLIATWWYQEVKSFFWWTSNFVVITGTFLYAKVKQMEMAKHHRENLANNHKV